MARTRAPLFSILAYDMASKANYKRFCPFGITAMVDTGKDIRIMVYHKGATEMHEATAFIEKLKAAKPSANDIMNSKLWSEYKA